LSEFDFWLKVLDSIPLVIRRRASAYLRNVKRISEREWKVWSDRGTEYVVHVKRGKVTCSCAYYEKEGLCKHIAAVCAHKLFEISRSLKPS
jgi:hypothetical protein